MTTIRHSRRTTAPDAQPTRDLPITSGQAQLLTSLQRTIAAAQSQMQAAASAILAGHDIDSAEIVGLGGTPEKPVLVIRTMSGDTGRS